MHRTDDSGHSSNLFVDGNPATGVQATVVSDDWLNAIQEELANTITGNGTALVKGTNTQLHSLVSLLVSSMKVGGRITLTTAVPVTVSDVTGATTVYVTPYNGNRIGLWNGTFWNIYTFAEMSQTTTDNTKSPAAVANNSNYDVFTWIDSTTMRSTRGPAWTSDTGRGTGAGTTELELYEGRYVNKVAITNGPAARAGLYMGTIRSNGSAQIDDTAAFRHVWNNYNRVPRAMVKTDSTASWDYTTATYRYARGQSTNRLSFVRGLDEDSVQVEVKVTFSNTSTNVIVVAAVGLDSSTTLTGRITSAVSQVSTFRMIAGGSYSGTPGLGFHFAAWIEFSVATGTTTWIGNSESGISGTVWG